MKTYRVGVTVTDRLFGYVTVQAENEDEAADRAASCALFGGRYGQFLRHSWDRGAEVGSILATEVSDVDAVENRGEEK